ncbi:RagB/SusD family nutrient uptake outer membrane protein [Sunxiuqinia elliptica]|uniref:Putative outer membrane starch-binding protein n=1 Tax=Sunxiuqinia elliptica TaxID=655355 RepID=A0A4R6H6B6_9BACT|nr:RagB/SusD family nutrient uptake outer membrane protein [Sunxiuqinia elliptica]TDO03447.1 putative outer membrane starch-binding protein [Sunxiuqinia elliptica]TDO59643.1 putative outer membrane starch-binding protein [Sunxiuqinia elliptica]
MKNRLSKIYLLAMFGTFLLLGSSCQDEFLKKPLGSDLNVDSIFSTSSKVESAIARAYGLSLASGIPMSPWDHNNTYMLMGASLPMISGEVNPIKYNWTDGWRVARSGLMADNGSGKTMSDDGFGTNYRAIRHDYLVIENIENVSDMSDTEKTQVIAEMKALIAYRYLEMFKRYGGVPIVNQTLSVADEIMIPRATLEETLNHIVDICDDVVTILPDSYTRTWTGRATKGMALAVKAEALLYASRPLFNASSPYMDLGEYNNLICFGNQDNSRWQKAIDASLAVIEWAESNGYHIIDTNNPLDDYGTAVSTPGNAEVLVAYKYQFQGWGSPLHRFYNPHTEDGGSNGMSFIQLSQYYKADGGNQEWTDETVSPFSEYVTKMEEMEPRLKASVAGAGMDSWNNPNDIYWSSQVLANASTYNGRGGTEGCARRVKFWYKAGTREWFEFPIYRLAEFYLNLAEAYNELGQSGKSLEYLNVIRDRAGLPDVVETDQDELRKIIQREWAIEFFEENHRLHDIKHWKLDAIDKGIIGGEKYTFKFEYKNGSYGEVVDDYISYAREVAFSGYWSDKQFLNPFPQIEINKGYLVQNPGY